MIDNLDRYDPKVVDDLLFKGSRSLQQLRCHLIVTPPIALHFKPVSERIDQAFEPEQMFAVRLRAQEQPYTAFDPNARGRKLLLEALDKRMDVGKLIPDRAAQDRLVSASGGAIRDLLRLVRESIILAHGAVIDLPTIERPPAWTCSINSSRSNTTERSGTTCTRSWPSSPRCSPRTRSSQRSRRMGPGPRRRSELP